MSTNLVNAPLQGFKIPIGAVPEEANVISMPVNFANDTTFNFDLTKEQQAMRLPFVQTVFIDNSADANSLTLTFQDGGLNFSMKVKGNTQGYYTVPVQQGNIRGSVTSTQGAVTKTIIFMSMAVQAFQWATA